MHLHSVNRGRESASAYHMAGFTQMLTGSLRRTFCKKCNHDNFDAEYIYGFVMGGFVRQVDEVGATEPAHRHACARIIVTLQLQDGDYGLLMKRYSTSSKVD